MWDMNRVLSSSRVLSLASLTVIGISFILNVHETHSYLSQYTGVSLILYLWYVIVSIFKRSSHPDFKILSGRKIFLLFVTILCSYSFLYTSMNITSNGRDFSNASDETLNDPKNKPKTALQSMFDFLYFSMVSMSTVGYGDVSPKSYRAKFLVCTHLMAAFVLAGILVNRIE